MKAVICGFSMVVLGAFLHDLTWHRMSDGGGYSDFAMSAWALVMFGSFLSAFGGLLALSKEGRK